MIAFEAVEQAVKAVEPTIAVAQEGWQLAEFSLLEVLSLALIIQVLEENGFTITSRSTAGVPTAFMTEYGRGKPVIGILTEYDALPDLGTVPTGISMHTWAATACHGMSLGLKRAGAAANILAATGADLLTDAALQSAARRDFEQRTAGVTCASAIDLGQAHPIGLPEYMVESCQREFFAEAMNSPQAV